ncbi:MAG: FKBP-type peptidyl-prolyl cis-trans isomerase [Kofleriaceae bacterium]
MRRLAVVLLLVAGCQKSGEDNKNLPLKVGSGGSGHGSGSNTRPRTEQIKPPFDVKQPPSDAIKTASGLVYKKTVTNEKGAVPKRNDTVLINYTGWRQATGETFFSNRSRGQPMPLNLAGTAAGFTEGLQLFKKGEKGMLWMPPAIGYKGPPTGKAETLVYEIDLVEILPAPAIPQELQPPATAQTTKSGVKYVSVRAGTGADKVHSFDTVTFNYTGWESDGHMFDSTEMRKRPATMPPFKQTRVMEDILTAMTAGERVRFWVDADTMGKGKPLPGAPKGLLTYEVEVLQIAKGIAPPPAPADVAAPPAGVQKTAKGVSYKVLRAGKGGAKCKPNETVRVNYTGWTTDGRMFDSSAIKGEPTEFRLDGVIAGWTDGLQLMSVGDKYRFWIPEEMAYKGAPNRPQGMLVFEIEMVEIKAPPPPGADPHGKGGAIPPAPPDVAKPPADALKTEKGVFYKFLGPKKTGSKPAPSSRVKVHYSGWTTDGKGFDSSYKSGNPAQFSLGGVIAGWTDGLQVMSVGDKARFWIPEELAYKGSPGKPQGMLVFDIELLEITQ